MSRTSRRSRDSSYCSICEGLKRKKDSLNYELRQHSINHSYSYDKDPHRLDYNPHHHHTHEDYLDHSHHHHHHEHQQQHGHNYRHHREHERWTILPWSNGVGSGGGGYIGGGGSGGGGYIVGGGSGGGGYIGGGGSGGGGIGGRRRESDSRKSREKIEIIIKQLPMEPIRQQQQQQFQPQQIIVRENPPSQNTNTITDRKQTTVQQKEIITNNIIREQDPRRYENRSSADKYGERNPVRYEEKKPEKKYEERKPEKYEQRKPQKYEEKKSERYEEKKFEKYDERRKPERNNIPYNQNPPQSYRESEKVRKISRGTGQSMESLEEIPEKRAGRRQMPKDEQVQERPITAVNRGPGPTKPVEFIPVPTRFVREPSDRVDDSSFEKKRIPKPIILEEPEEVGLNPVQVEEQRPENKAIPTLCFNCHKGQFVKKFTWTGIIAALICFPCGIYFCFLLRTKVCSFCGIYENEQ